jgi:hypothetical protein
MGSPCDSKDGGGFGTLPRRKAGKHRGGRNDDR